MKRIDTTIPGVILIEPDVNTDDRGFFYESYHRAKFAELGITDRFVQDNHSRSVKGTLRGLHYQVVRPQAKLCRVIMGEVLDVAVDIRRGSPTFGKHVTATLSAENRRLMFVPAGFAHGFLVLSTVAEFLYKCSDYYFREHDRGLAWNDPQLAIGWDITAPLLSPKDASNPRLWELPASELPSYH